MVDSMVGEREEDDDMSIKSTDDLDGGRSIVRKGPTTSQFEEDRRKNALSNGHSFRPATLKQHGNQRFITSKTIAKDPLVSTVGPVGWKKDPLN